MITVGRRAALRPRHDCDPTERALHHDRRGALPAAVRERRAGRVPAHAAPRPRAPAGTRASSSTATTRRRPRALPSRATLFTGQYPSLHGVTNTDGLAKAADRPGDALARSRHGAHDGRLVPRRRLPHALPGQVAHLPRRPARPAAPTRACGSNDDDGALDRRRGRRLPTGPTGSTRSASRGWIGREPHGADPADTGFVRDGDLRRAGRRPLRRARGGRRRRAVADGGVVREPARHRVHRRGVGAARLPAHRRHGARRSPRRRRRRDSFDGRPTAQRQFHEVWPQHALRAADRRGLPPPLPLAAQGWSTHAIGRILDALEASRLRRRHHRRVHVRPRRPARRPRRPAAEVAQRVRRGHPRAAAGLGPGHRRRRADGVHDRHQPRRPAPDAARPRRRRRRAPRRRVSPCTTSRPSRSSAATCQRCSCGRRPTETIVDAPVYFMTEDQITPGPRPTEPVHRRAVRAGGGAGQGRVGDHPAADRRRRRGRALEAQPLLRPAPRAGGAHGSAPVAAEPRGRGSGSSTTSPPIPRSAPTSPPTA